MSPREFTLTPHAIKRLEERFPMLALQLSAYSGRTREKMVYFILENSLEVPDFFEQFPEYRRRLEAKYPGERFAFFRNRNVLFCGRVDGEKKYIGTVLAWGSVEAVARFDEARENGEGQPCSGG